MVALLINVTLLSEISYGKKVGLRAGLRAGGRKSHIYYPIFFSIAEKRLEGLILGYQQVIHNAIMPTEGNCTGCSSINMPQKRGAGVV